MNASRPVSRSVCRVRGEMSRRRQTSWPSSHSPGSLQRFLSYCLSTSSKDPHVVNFQGRYLMYHSIPPMKGEPDSGWNIGIAESKDLMNWTKVGTIAVLYIENVLFLII